jgi:hypothetical protein
MSGARCVPRRRVRANHRPARPIVAGNVSALGRSAIEAAATYTAASIPTLRPGPGGFDQGPATVDCYGSPAGRPPWALGRQFAELGDHPGLRPRAGVQPDASAPPVESIWPDSALVGGRIAEERAAELRAA